MKYLLLFHDNNGYVKVPQCYIYMFTASLVTSNNVPFRIFLVPSPWYLIWTEVKSS